MNQFLMDTQIAELPVRVNGNPLFKNDHEQVYQLTNQFFTESHEINLKIRFLIRLGYAPILRVEDGQKRAIEYEFVDAKEPEIKGYLPVQDIQDIRLIKSKEKVHFIEFVNLQKLRYELYDIQSNLDISKLDFLTCKLESSWKKIHRIRESGSRARGVDPLMHINVTVDSINKLNLIEILENINLNQIVEFILELLDRSSHIVSSNKVDFLVNNFVFIGKLYSFSSLIQEETMLNFFDARYVNIISNAKEDSQVRLRIMDEYWRFLARVSTSEKLQLAYFRLFFEDLSYGNAYFSDVYLWGYSRILLWYSNFKYPQYKDYRLHANEIIKRMTENYLPINITGRRATPEEEKNYQYKQNSFLSLIYLLSFRAKDRKFFAKNTEEYKKAHQLIDKLELRGEKIILKAVHETKPLASIYRDFLDQVERPEDIDRIKKID